MASPISMFGRSHFAWRGAKERASCVTVKDPQSDLRLPSNPFGCGRFCCSGLRGIVSDVS